MQLQAQAKCPSASRRSDPRGRRLRSAGAAVTAISGFVVAYNRAALLGTCLRSLRFVDELIVIDKSSTDGSPRIARRYADRVITVPWSPTVEETRGFALAQCRHDRIVFLDDDEMLSPGAIVYLRCAARGRCSRRGGIAASPLDPRRVRCRCLLLARAPPPVLSQGRRHVRPARAWRHRRPHRSRRAGAGRLADLDRAPVAPGCRAVDRADQPLHLARPARGRARRTAPT